MKRIDSEFLMDFSSSLLLQKVSSVLNNLKHKKYMEIFSVYSSTNLILKNTRNSLTIIT